LTVSYFDVDINPIVERKGQTFAGGDSIPSVMLRIGAPIFRIWI
jgi:hypothetical protein